MQNNQKDLKNINTNEITKDAWDAYQEDYAKLHELNYEWAKSHAGLDCYEPMISLIGDVKGLKLLDTCCSCDAWQAYSWHNRGAKVTACDIAPKAIEIVRKNAEIMEMDIECVVADMQKLEPIADDEFDIVFASYPIYVQDIFEACRNWHRVLKKGGRLLWWAEHPISHCIEEDDIGVHIKRNYNQPSATLHDFNGTDGKWHSDLSWVQNFWRISDLVNAVCDAGFCITKIHEDCESDKKLPDGFMLLAVK